MNQTGIIIAQYAIQYGVPAVLELIKLIKKDEFNPDDWEAMFARVKTPFRHGMDPGMIRPDPAPAPNAAPENPPPVEPSP